MSGRQITPQSYVEKYLQERIRRGEEVILNAVIYVGETCVKEARENGSYIDRTGNLRSSIGYVILEDGVVYNKKIYEADKGTDKTTGRKKGKEFMDKIIAEHRNTKGIVLIVVAGMEYAAYVEAKNYNVLTSSELLAQKLVPQILKRLGFKTV